MDPIVNVFHINYNKICLKISFFLLNLSPRQLKDVFKVSHCADGRVYVEYCISDINDVAALLPLVGQECDIASLSHLLSVNKCNSIEYIRDVLSMAILPLATRALTGWQMLPIIEARTIGDVSGQYVFFAPNKYTGSVTAFCRSVRETIVAFVEELSHKGLYVLNINIKQKSRKHECAFPPRVSAVVQNLFHNAKQTHAVFCSQIVSIGWLENVCAIIGVDVSTLSTAIKNELRAATICE